MTSRILGSLGRFFITAGIVILLFVAYQLWGTGLQEASAQSDLGSDFDELLDSVDAAPETTTTTTTSTTTAPGPTTTTTTTTIPEAGGTIPVIETALAEKLFREGGEAIARINIPKIRVNKIVVQGVQVEDLRNGPGHYRATVFPGQEGNSGIAGHRTTYGAPFNRIDELVPGDEIRVTTVQGEHLYRVLPAGEAYAPEALGTLGADFSVPEGQEDLGHIIVGPSATWVLGDFGDNRITLTACHPKYSARQRIIVAAELVSEAVSTPDAPASYSTEDKIELPSEDLASEATGEDSADAQVVSAPATDPTDTPPTDGAGSDPTATDEVSLDEGLDGDKDALRPAILWGLLATAVYIFFKELAARWKRWPAIALGIVPVMILMSLSFEKIDRYLPAG